MGRNTIPLISTQITNDSPTRDLILLELLEAEENNITRRPSQISKKLNLVRSSVGDHLSTLSKTNPPLVYKEKRGIYKLTEQGRREANTKRPQENRTFELPYYGLIAAGEPVLMLSEAIDTWDMHGVDPRDHFLMQVTGDSMVHKHIADGDLVVLRRVSGWDRVNAGDIIAAAVPEGVDVELPNWLNKMLQQVEEGTLVDNLELNHITLKQLDSDMKTLIGNYGVIRAVFKPVGVVVQVIRDYRRNVFPKRKP